MGIVADAALGRTPAVTPPESPEVAAAGTLDAGSPMTGALVSSLARFIA